MTRCMDKGDGQGGHNSTQAAVLYGLLYVLFMFTATNMVMMEHKTVASIQLSFRAAV